MAGKLTSVMFDSLVQRFERMADGISRHKQEDGFPKLTWRMARIILKLMWRAGSGPRLGDAKGRIRCQRLTYNKR
jgi:hypothetical protein